MHYLVTQTKRRVKRHKQGALLAVLLGLILLSILVLLKSRTSSTTSEKSLIERVGRHVLLPDEVPTVATVSDISLLSDQPFFAHANNGDKVLLFRASNKAILYDPESDRVLDIGNIDSASSEGTPE